MGVGQIARHPAQHRIGAHIHSTIGRIGARGGHAGQSPFHDGRDLLLGQCAVINAEIIQQPTIVPVCRVLRAAEPILGRVAEILGQRGRRVTDHDRAVQVELHGHGAGIDHYGDVVPARREPAGSAQLGFRAGAAGRDGEPHDSGVGASDGRRQKHVDSCARADIEQALPGSALLGVIRPDGEGGIGQGVDQRSNGQGHIIIGRVELHGAVKLPGRPQGPADQRAVVLVLGRIAGRRARFLIELPPTDGSRARRFGEGRGQH